jgi:hypothetical protein
MPLRRLGSIAPLASNVLTPMPFRRKLAIFWGEVGWVGVGLGSGGAGTQHDGKWGWASAAASNTVNICRAGPAS